MPEYLSKEEIKQWRSSLEKITLEEYAMRLGKVVLEEKKTNDIVDIVLKGGTRMSSDDELNTQKSERLTSIVQRAFEREKQISHTPFSIHAQISQETPKKSVSKSKSAEKKEEKINLKSIISNVVSSEDNFIFNKALTDREQMVFDYFAKNLGSIVYAKDLATLLELPRDYVYKYIKNLRAKIQGDKLKNSDNGGYILLP